MILAIYVNIVQQWCVVYSCKDRRTLTMAAVERISMAEVASQSLQSEYRNRPRLGPGIFLRDTSTISNKIELMSLLIAIILLLSLCWGEFFAATEIESWQSVAIKVTFLTMLAPIFAAAQIFIGRKRHSNENASQWFPRFRMMAGAHTIAWAAVSGAIVIWFQWPVTVKLISIPKSIPLGDDLLLVAPALISLIASWAIFIYGAPEGCLVKGKPRTSVFVLWVRMQVIMVTAPILFAFFVTDCLGLAATVELSPSMQIAFWIACGLTLVASMLFYPQMMLLVWSTKSIKDKPFETRCQKMFQLAGIRPRNIRVWKTGNSIVNAAAVGIVPGTEVIIVSDMLLDKFSEQEVDAILLHEIGHIRHHHSIKRIALVLIPLILLAIDQATGVGLHQWIADNALLSSTFGSLTQFLPAVAFLAYLLVVSKTVFRNMEFEADRFAVETLSGTSDARAVESALEKMAVIYPRQIDRRSGLHPSIRQRLAFAIDLHAKILGENKPFESPAPAPTSISLDPIAAK